MNRDRILGLFFEDSERIFHIREIARLTKLNPNTVIKYGKELVKSGLLKEEKTKITKNLRANKDNPDFFFEKKLYNLRRVYYSGIIACLVDKYNYPDAIVLYGSYSKGEEAEKGDIDIAVITKKTASIDLSRFEKMLKRGIHLIELDLKKASPEFTNNLINGFVLYGRLVAR